MCKLLLATNNPHKLAEYREILAGLPMQLTSPRDEGLEIDPEETGRSFEENAVLKATAFAQASGLLTLADDSGLEIDALGGEPGIYSARYHNTAKDDHAGRCRVVLNKLAAQQTPWAKRTARFKCVIALANREKVFGTVSGAVEGLIALEPKGSGGFGYDPIFFVPELNKHMAELSAEAKHNISHRGRAARAALPLLKKICAAD
ncbi:MAG: RdgB/HAM1 family non-canonical purine NTP pyrophosphatase [Chloroflexi bacterium]|nr:MAG: RdgB/HAM1 family non-canonical purine NTP pyrophosphatase [Chloroflexota bacterium]